MNQETFEGQWMQMRGEMRSWWGKLSDNDIQTIGGQKDKLVGLLQEKYGYTMDQAGNEVERRFNEYSKSHGSALSGMKTKVDDLRDTAATKAREAVSAASDRLDKASSYVQESNFKTMATDVSGFVRKYPWQLIAVAIGVFYFFFRSKDR